MVSSNTVAFAEDLDDAPGDGVCCSSDSSSSSSSSPHRKPRRPRHRLMACPSSHQPVAASRPPPPRNGPLPSSEGGGGGVGIRQVPGPLQRVRKGLGPRRLRTLAITGGGRICDGQLLAGGGKASWEAFMGSGKNCGGTTWLGK